jgi:hypothetical protein
MATGNEFSEWDLIHELTAEEAALLICGVDPARTDIHERERSKGRVYERAVREAVARADLLAWQYFERPLSEERPLSPQIWEIEADFENYLPSFEIRSSVDDVFKDPENVPVLLPVDPWYSATVRAGDINKWLTLNSVKSSYKFKNLQSIVVVKLDHREALIAIRAGNELHENNFAAAEILLSKILVPEKPLGTRERNTLLCIIGIICKEAKLDFRKHSKTAEFIKSNADRLGVAIGETTIEDHLKLIPDALAGRMK